MTLALFLRDEFSKPFLPLDEIRLLRQSGAVSEREELIRTSGGTG